MLNDWSFRKKLIFLWLGVQLLVTGITAFLVVDIATKSLEKDLLYQAEQFKPILRSALLTPLIQRDYASVTAILKELLASESIETIRILDAKGHLLSLQAKVIGEKVIAPFMLDFPIEADGIVFANASVAISRVRLFKTRDQLIISSFIIGAMSLIVFLGFALLISRYITRPITNLAEIAKKITLGDYRAPQLKPRRDEIGLLQSAFQSMSSEIFQKIDALSFLNMNLEKTVQDRTMSLQQTKDELLQKVEELQLSGAVIDNSSYAISIVDLKETHTPIIYVNSAFEKVTGYFATDVLGLACRFFKNGITDEETAQLIHGAISTESDCTVDFFDQRKNGNFFWNRTSIFPIRGSEGSLRYYVVFQNDISVLKKVQMERESLLQEIQENQRLKSLGILVAGLAHEINNPLGVALTATSHVSQTAASMRNQIENLQPQQLTEFLQDEETAHQLIFENLQRASELVRGFKDIAVDRSQDEIREIHLQSYLHSIEQSLIPILKRAHCLLKLNIDPDIKLQTHAGSLGQLVTNLILNATIHAFSGITDRQIIVEACQEDTMISLKIIDNGNGIPSSVIPNLFIPFFTTNRAHGGSGLGLYISRQIAVDVMKGSLRVENLPDRGCVFTLQVPRSNPSKVS